MAQENHGGSAEPAGLNGRPASC